jgi:hypothetical protein
VSALIFLEKSENMADKAREINLSGKPGLTISGTQNIFLKKSPWPLVFSPRVVII